MADTATNIHIDHLRVDVPPHPFTIKNKIREDWFDWTWAKSIIDLRDYLLPITWRKFAFYLLYGVMLAAVIATEIVFNWFSLVIRDCYAIPEPDRLSVITEVVDVELKGVVLV